MGASPLNRKHHQGWTVTCLDRGSEKNIPGTGGTTNRARSSLAWPPAAWEGKGGRGGGQIQGEKHLAFGAVPSFAKAQEVALLKYF